MFERIPPKNNNGKKLHFVQALWTKLELFDLFVKLTYVEASCFNENECSLSFNIKNKKDGQIIGGKIYSMFWEWEGRVGWREDLFLFLMD